MDFIKIATFVEGVEVGFPSKCRCLVDDGKDWNGICCTHDVDAENLDAMI
jgi:hypothetical protein